MGLLDTLGQLLNANQINDHQADQITREAPRDALGDALAGLFRGNETPPMSQQVSELFGRSDSQQQAGMLNQILATLGPAAATVLAGTALGKLLRPGQTQVSADDAAKIDPSQVRDVVVRAEQAQPNIADELGKFYAEHSGLIKPLGSAALLIAAAKLKQNMDRR